MYVVVVGMGQVGRHVVRALDQDGHHVVAIDSDPAVVESIEDEHDVATLVGYGASPSILRQAGCERADLMVAVTDNDEVNLVAALAARGMGTTRSIARVQGEEYCESGQGILYGLLGIDVVINPRILVAHELARIARSRGALDVLNLAGDRVEVVKIELPSASKMLHKALANLNLPQEVLVAAVVRDGELFVPGGADVLLPGDRIYIIGKAGNMKVVQQQFTGAREAARVCIIGGGVVGHMLARQLSESDVEVLVIEKHHRTAEDIKIDLPGVTVIHGDGTDVDVLEDEQVGSFDLVAAVTAEDEVNLMAGLVAKRVGAGKAAALVQRADYMDIYHQLGIDVVLSPRLVASENILRYVRQNQLQSLYMLEDGQAEVLELVAAADSRVVGTPISRLNMPRGALLAAIVSRDKVTVPHGSDQIQAGDAVVILTRAATRPAVERLFRKRAL
ncbi:MAG: Trk system potassium transporter TrkA [Alphaproteobacteria bacterium]|nr:Trk system potassium transporter TrkA [Alphaproteobacteria bacterium]